MLLFFYCSSHAIDTSSTTDQWRYVGRLYSTSYLTWTNISRNCLVSEEIICQRPTNGCSFVRSLFCCNNCLLLLQQLGACLVGCPLVASITPQNAELFLYHHTISQSYKSHTHLYCVSLAVPCISWLWMFIVRHLQFCRFVGCQLPGCMMEWLVAFLRWLLPVVSFRALFEMSCGGIKRDYHQSKLFL